MASAAGLLIGFVWEWLREWRHRADARGRAREVESLQREVGRLRATARGGKDDIMALLEAPGGR